MLAAPEVETNNSSTTCRVACGESVPIPNLVVDGLKTKLCVEIPATSVEAVLTKNGINCAWFVVFSVGVVPAETPVSPEPSPMNEVAVTIPVILTLPVPVISLLLRSKLPPSCGLVSPTI